MSREYLVGGTVRARGAARRNGTSDKAPAPQVGYRFLAALILVGAGFAAVGAARVHTVFDARDRSIETVRLQEAARKKNDRSKVLAARIAHLQRTEILKAAAEERLGMAEPLPTEMETIVVPEEVYRRWQDAAANATPDYRGKEQ